MAPGSVPPVRHSRSPEMVRYALAAVALTALMLAPALARAADDNPPLPREQWSFDGVFGTYDRASSQRGFQVYKEV